jgi:hypothetical protein
MTTLKNKIENSIKQFAEGNITDNAFKLFETLAYETSQNISSQQTSYQYFYDSYVENSENKHRFNPVKALSSNWLAFNFLFQLDEKLAGVTGGKVQNQEMYSAAFACLELNEIHYSRSQLAEITRQINLIFVMPVVLLFKYDNKITLSVIHRRINKKDEQKDVLENVSLIKDISISNPHRAQIEILNDFAFTNLANNKKPNNFVELTQAWEQVFSTKALNKKFFKKIANWYFLSVAYSQFPYEYLKKDPKLQNKTDDELQELANQKATIRFITRMIFVWFLKEKKLIADDFFDAKKISKILKNFNQDDSSDYYNAILQNLFFATLNRPKDHRKYATDKGYHKNREQDFDENSFYRYEKMFQDEKPENIMKLFESIPFLNGGLFDSLDTKDKDKRIIIDGFSRKNEWQAKMPDFLFFEKEALDFNQELRKIYDTKKEKYEVKGLFEIFNEYKFTIEENTPTETDVALDPYLLGEIFENLLAYYNPETGSTARKGTGSFYTPQEIVNYMVDESLKAYLDTKLNFEYIPENAKDLDDVKKTALVKALSEVKILDPACGSGAFPMGVLYKMVDRLKHIDPDNTIWKAVQKEKIIGNKIAELEADKKAITGLSDKQVKEKATKAVEDRLQDLETIFNNEYNFDDYARKLYIIQNCIYGVDIQDVAIQISKLRFFLSLIVDQKNDDIQPLPNLETKFVIANTLIGIDLPKFTLMGEDDHSQDSTKALKEELKKVRNNHFKASNRKDKQKLKAQDQAIREQIANSLADTVTIKNQYEIDQTHKQIDKLKQDLIKANQLPEIQEVETGTLFETKKVTINPRKAKITEINQSIKNCESKIASLQADSQADLIREQALKIAQWDIYNQNASADWFDMDWMFGIQDGFDVVIGNPPYVGEKGNKETFEQLKKSPLGERFYLGKMDLFYFFFHLGIDVVKESGIVNFITTNYYITATGAKKLRKDIEERTSILNLVNFNEFKVFESAQGQHNIITTLKKGKFNEPAKTININIKGFTKDNIIDEILQGKNQNTDYGIIEQNNIFKNENIVLGNNNIDEILNKITKFKALKEVCDVKVGLRTGIDKISNNHKKIDNLFNLNDSVFVLRINEIINFFFKR